MSELWGFIGAGNMGGALIRAAAKTLPAGSIGIADRDESKAAALAAEVAAQTADNTALAREARLPRYRGQAADARRAV